MLALLETSNKLQFLMYWKAILKQAPSSEQFPNI